MTHLKYVITKDGEPFIFPASWKHSDFAMRVGGKGNIASAGKDLEVTKFGLQFAHGSETLGIPFNKEQYAQDKKTLNWYFGIEDKALDDEELLVKAVDHINSAVKGL